jgi:hypothetical protein
MPSRKEMSTSIPWSPCWKDQMQGADRCWRDPHEVETNTAPLELIPKALRDTALD